MTHRNRLASKAPDAAVTKLEDGVILYIARNQIVIGSFDESKKVPAVRRVWRWQRLNPNRFFPVAKVIAMSSILAERTNKALRRSRPFEGCLELSLRVIVL